MIKNWIIKRSHDDTTQSICQTVSSHSGDGVVNEVYGKGWLVVTLETAEDGLLTGWIFGFNAFWEKRNCSSVSQLSSSFD